MRSGCLNLMLMLVAALAATALTAVGVILVLSFAAAAFESPTGLEMVLRTVVGLIAGYFFVRVGLSVWRDLRHRPTEGEEKERGPAGNGGH
jgi:hypothetical protein